MNFFERKMRLEDVEECMEKCFGALICFLYLCCQGAVNQRHTEAVLMEEKPEIYQVDI